MKRETFYHSIYYRAILSAALASNASMEEIEKDRVAFMILQVMEQYKKRHQELEKSSGHRMASTLLAGWKTQFLKMVTIFDQYYDGYSIRPEEASLALSIYYRYWNSTDVGFYDIGEETLLSLTK